MYKYRTQISLVAMLLLAACGGGSGPESPAPSPLGPSPNFTNQESLKQNVDGISDEAVESLGKAFSNTPLEDTSSSGTAAKQTAQELSFDFSTVKPLSGAKGGTVTPSGSFTGRFVSEQEFQLNFNNLTLTFSDFSEKGEYILKSGTIVFNATLSKLASDASGIVEAKILGNLTVGGKVGANVTADIQLLQGTLTPFKTESGKEDMKITGTVTGTIAISTDTKASVCNVAGNLDSSQENAADQIQISCPTS